METYREIRKDKINSKSYAPIRVVATYNGERARINAKHSVHIDGWDPDRQKVKTDQPFHLRINSYLDLLENTITDILEEAIKKDIHLSEAELKAAVALRLDPPKASDPEILQSPEPEAEPVSFFKLMADFINQKATKRNKKGRKLSPKTITGYWNTLDKFDEFEGDKNYPLTLEGMNNDFYTAFANYFLDEKKQGINTLGKHIGRLKEFLEWCEDQEHQVCIKYRKFATPEEYVGVDALTEEEVLALYKYDFKTKETVDFIKKQFRKEFGYDMNPLMVSERVRVLEQMRDNMLMLCYTGMRISTLWEFSPKHIKGDIIRIKSDKTIAHNIESVIPFFDDHIFKPVELVEKYAGRFETCMPVNKAINAYLKDIQELAGITRLNLTTKIGRKTFATLKLYQGVPQRIIMLATGHKTEKSFNRYVGLDTIKMLETFREKSKEAGKLKKKKEKRGTNGGQTAAA